MADPVFRAPLRSRRDGVEWAAAVERALGRRVVGVGEPDDDRADRRLARFRAAPDGSLVWTRHPDGRTFLGRMTGPSRRDDDGAGVDLVHVRDCDWITEPVVPALVPAAVAQTFSRGGRSWQRIHPGDVEAQTARLWDWLGR